MSNSTRKQSNFCKQLKKLYKKIFLIFHNLSIALKKNISQIIKYNKNFSYKDLIKSL